MVKKQHNNFNNGSDEDDHDNAQFHRDYRKFLFSQFPSKFLANKIHADEEETRLSKPNRAKSGAATASANSKSNTNAIEGITTRSGKVIRRITPTQIAQITQIPAQRSGEKPKNTNTVVSSAATKQLKKASPVTEKQFSSKPVSAARGVAQQSKLYGGAKSIGDDKKKIRRPVSIDPPSSSDATSDEDGDHETATTTTDGSRNDYEGELMDEASGGGGTISRKKQAAAHLKKLLSKNLNIVITMNAKGRRRNGDDDEDDDEYDEDDDEYDEDDDDDEDDDEDDEDDDEDDEDDDDEDDDDEDDDDEDDDDEDDDDEDDEYDDDDDEDDEYDDDVDDESTPKSKSLRRSGSNNSLLSNSNASNASSIGGGDFDFGKFVNRYPIGRQAYEKDEATVKMLLSNIRGLLKSDKDNSVLRAYFEQLKNAAKKLNAEKIKRITKEKKTNCNEFKKMLRKRNATNDLAYFKKNLTPEEQRVVLKEIQEVNKISFSDVPYRLSVLQSNIPRSFKSIAMSKISSLRHMEPGSGEYFKIKNWVDGFMKLPFNAEKALPITLAANGMEECGAFMELAKKRLDEAVFGLDDAKLQIMQLVGQWISNPDAMGTAVAIQGPPGTGKTSLIKDGVSKILGRDFAFIALGGATDSSFLEGHSYTYEGSTWGKIVDILMQCKTTNPVIYFDELDKISETPKGDEIVGILTHLTDSTQNSQFHDKYFAEINFDLSKCLFIFSYNDESRVNRVLLDRMYRIHTTGYNTKEKVCITQNYLVPKIMEQVRFNAGDVIIPQEMIEYIVENYTDKEDGVRNLKRCMEIVHTKLNLYRLMKPESITTMFSKDMKTKVSFPFTLTRDNLEQLLKKNETKLCYGLYL
jgi:hypothetical protein